MVVSVSKKADVLVSRGDKAEKMHGAVLAQNQLPGTLRPAAIHSIQ
jgi:fatty acid/phospholipid biosynthesis enzyme